LSGDRFVRACPQHNVEIYESPDGLRCPKGKHPVGKWKVVDRLKGLAVSAATAEDGEVPAAPLAVSLPQIQQDLASYKGRLLADLREVERAIEAMTLVQHAWESQHSAGRLAATRR
jgi:hypothetical protein